MLRVCDIRAAALYKKSPQIRPVHSRASRGLHKELKAPRESSFIGDRLCLSDKAGQQMRRARSREKKSAVKTEKEQESRRSCRESIRRIEIASLRCPHRVRSSCHRRTAACVRETLPHQQSICPTRLETDPR